MADEQDPRVPLQLGEPAVQFGGLGLGPELVPYLDEVVLLEDLRGDVRCLLGALEGARRDSTDLDLEPGETLGNLLDLLPARDREGALGVPASSVHALAGLAVPKNDKIHRESPTCS